LNFKALQDGLGFKSIGISEQAQRVGDKIKAAMEARKRDK
jgi:hypothetical protein